MHPLRSGPIRNDLVLGVVVAIGGVVYYLETRKIRTTTDVVDPGTFPALIGIGLALLGLVMVGKSLLAARRASLPASGKTPGAGPGAAGDAEAGEPVEPLGKLLVYFAIFFAYLFLLIPVGFMLSTAAFLMALTTVYDRSKWLRNVIFSVVFAVVVYYAFKEGLGVFLPPGILG